MDDLLSSLLASSGQEPEDEESTSDPLAGFMDSLASGGMPPGAQGVGQTDDTGMTAGSQDARDMLGLLGALMGGGAQGGAPAGGDLGGLLGALMGGGTQGGQTSGAEGGDLGGLLGALMGGGAQSGAPMGGQTSGAQGGGDLGGLLGALMGGGAQAGGAPMGGQTSGAQGGGDLGGLLGALMGGGAQGGGASSPLTSIVTGLAEKVGLPPQIAQLVVGFVLNKLLSGSRGGAQVTSRSGGGELADQGADELLAKMNSGQRIDAQFLESSGLTEELSQQAGLDPETAAASLQEVLSMLGGKTG